MTSFRAKSNRRHPRPIVVFVHKIIAFTITVALVVLSKGVSNEGACAESGGVPNIVFILADDLGIGDVNCYGGERCQIQTPHLDSLARDGMRFTDAHTVASVCVPARMAIMTGRYPWRFQPPRPDGSWGYLNPRLDVSGFTLGKMLKGAGYRTGYVGKWHLGTLMQTTDGENQGPENVDYDKPLKIGPADYGFDESFILPGSLDMYPYAFVRNGEFVGEVTARKGWSAFHRVGPAAEDFEDYKVLDRLSSEAERFIAASDSASQEGQPFFLYLALTSPHTPISPSPEFEGKSQLGLYGDFVMETDHCVGRVLAALKKHGLDKDTLVMASSDHGAGAYAGNIRKATPGQIRELEKQGHYSSGIYRGYKFSILEGGLRVPLVARWPGVVEPGSECHRLVGLIDLVATCAELCGAELSDNEAVDSVSFAPLLKNPHADSPRKDFIMQSTRAFAIRSGPWKLALCPGSGCPGRYGNEPKQQQAWKEAVAAIGRRPRDLNELKQAPFVQLFQLESDPAEAKNLAAQHPDRVQEMISTLEQHIARGRSTPGPVQQNDKPKINYFSGVPRFVLP